MVGGLLEVIDGQNWSRLGDYLSESVGYVRPGYAPLRGLAQVEHFYREVRVIRDGTHRIDGILADDLNGCCWGEFSGVDRHGRAIDTIQFCDVYSFRFGLIDTRHTYFHAPLV